MAPHSIQAPGEHTGPERHRLRYRRTNFERGEGRASGRSCRRRLNRNARGSGPLGQVPRHVVVDDDHEREHAVERLGEPALHRAGLGADPAQPLPEQRNPGAADEGRLRLMARRRLAGRLRRDLAAHTAAARPRPDLQALFRGGLGGVVRRFSAVSCSAREALPRVARPSARIMIVKLRLDLLDLIVCPGCRFYPLRRETFEPRPGVNRLDGVIVCPGCGRWYPIEDGLLELLVEALAYTADRERFRDQHADQLRLLGLDHGGEPASAVERANEIRHQQQHFDWYADNAQQTWSAVRAARVVQALDSIIMDGWRRRIAWHAPAGHRLCSGSEHVLGRSARH